MTERAPLTTLLAWAWTAFTIETDNAAEVTGSEHVGRLFNISLAMWANGLRFIDEGGITVDDLRSRARAQCNIGGLERWGWISVGEISGKRRDGYGSHRGVRDDTMLRPTRAGSYARRLWPSVVATVEDRWQERFGPDVISSLRAALQPPSPLPSSQGAMPWSPPEVHPSDGFYSHVVNGPVLMDDAPLVALLGQVLTSLTVAQEEDAEVSLPLGANFLRVVGTGTVRARDLPAMAGVSKEAVAMAVGFLGRRHLAELLPGRSVRLTATGLDALDGFWARAAIAKDEALSASLDAILSRRETVAAGLVPPPGCWRGEKPYLSQTRRVLADPTAALPWQPMVLHRGGWPDGS